MRKICSKLICCILAAVMILTMFPLTVFGAENDSEKVVIGETYDNSLSDIALDEALPVTVDGEEVKLSFEPSVSGYYEFYSQNSVGDPYGYIYNSDYEQIASNDNSYYADFSIYIHLDADTLYYLGAYSAYGNYASYEAVIELIKEDCPHSERMDTEGYAPTCTTEGHTNGEKCCLCGEWLSGEVIPVLGHPNVVTIEEAKQPTCLEWGYSSYDYCNDCEQILRYNDIVSLLGHEYETQIIDGEEKQVCKRCGCIYTSGVELDFVIEDVDTLRVDVYLDNMMDLIGGKYTIGVDENSLLYEYCDLGEDAVNTNNQMKVNRNGVTALDNYSDQGVITSFAFTDSLNIPPLNYYKSNYESNGSAAFMTPIDWFHYHVESFYFSIVDFNAESTQISFNGEFRFGYDEKIIEKTYTVDLKDPTVCRHTNTVTIGISEQPTCINFGYASYDYCNDCEQILRYNDIVSLLGHDYETQIIDGEEKQVCKRCGRIYNYGVELGFVIVDNNTFRVDVYFDNMMDLNTCRYTIGFDEDSINYKYLSYGEDAEKTQTQIKQSSNGVSVLDHCTDNEVTTSLAFVESLNIPPLNYYKNSNAAFMAPIDWFHYHAVSYYFSIVDFNAKTTQISINGVFGFANAENLLETETYTVDLIAKPVHKHDYQAVTTPATCKAEGQTVYTCSKCQDTYTETIAKLSHVPVTVKAVAATCTSTGLTEGTKCSLCGEILTAQQTTNKTAHKWNAGTVFTPPTTEKAGVKIYTCTVCNATKTESIPKLTAKIASDKTTGVSVSYPENAYGNTITLKVTKQAEIANYTAENYEKITAYDITTLVNGKAAQPGVPVTVNIPLPAGYNAATTAVYHVEKNGSKTKVNATVKNGMITITANSFSVYLVVDEASKVTIKLGDINNDGAVDAADARLALRKSVNLEKYAPGSREFKAGDVDKNNTVDAADARHILRASVKLEDPTKW